MVFISNEDFNVITLNSINLSTDDHYIADEPNEVIQSIYVANCIVICLTKKNENGIFNGMYHLSGYTPWSQISDPDAFDDEYTVDDFIDEFAEMYGHPDIVYIAGGNLNTAKDLFSMTYCLLENKFEESPINTTSPSHIRWNGS